ncbi:MAG TPA: FHA domain-containing protein, partial [Candidatus Dormibacteraeota bacterium]
MELRLVVEAHGLPERELAVEVQPGHDVRELMDALVAQLELKPGRDELALYCRRTSAWLADSEEIRATGLRTGDRVVLVDRRRPIANRARPAALEPMVDLLVVGGPTAGRRMALPAGDHRVGSHPYSDIMLDDPALSRVHVLVTVDRFGHVSVADAGSDSGVFVAGQRIAGPTPIPHGQLVAAGRTLLGFEAHDRPRTEQHSPDETGRIAFNRPPRVARPKPEMEFKLEAPPAKERGGRLPLSSALVPLGMGLVMYFVIRQVYFLLFMLLSPVMMVFSLFETGIGGRRGFKRRRNAWRGRLKELEREMAASRAAEAAHLEASAPNTAVLADRARTLDPSLWERRPDDPDWLLLRTGWRDRASSISLDLAQGGEEALRAEADGVVADHHMLHAVPLLVSLKEAGVLGISGDSRQATALARSLGIQLATLHSPQDLVLAAAVPAAERGEWAWLGWLPHVRSESSPVAGPLLVTDRTGARAL